MSRCRRRRPAARSAGPRSNAAFSRASPPRTTRARACATPRAARLPPVLATPRDSTRCALAARVRDATRALVVVFGQHEACVADRARRRQFEHAGAVCASPAPPTSSVSAFMTTLCTSTATCATTHAASRPIGAVSAVAASASVVGVSFTTRTRTAHASVVCSASRRGVGAVTRSDGAVVVDADLQRHGEVRRHRTVIVERAEADGGAASERRDVQRDRLRRARVQRRRERETSSAAALALVERARARNAPMPRSCPRRARSLACSLN